MRLHAAFVPPRPALEELERAVMAARRAQESEPVRPGLFGRRLVPQPTELVPLSVDHTPTADMQLPVAGFGNVTTADAGRVVAALTAAAVRWPRPRLVFAGAEVVESSADTTAWATIDGDLDSLRQIAHDVTRRVEHVGFFVDRRRYHPGVEVARATAATQAADLEAIVAALEAYAGQPWTIDRLTIFTTVVTGESLEFREFEQIPLGGDGRG